MRHKILFITLIAVTTVIAQIGPPIGGGGGTIVGGGGGTVTSFSFVDANGITGTVQTPSTTPALTLSLGAIMPTTVDKITFTTPATAATLTLGNNTTTVINGGGTLSLSNFSLTVPATGTAAVGAGNVSATSTNNVTINGHTHAVTASSNPGTATSLLESDVNGRLQLNRIGLGTAATTYPLQVAGNAFFNSGPSNPTAIFLRNATTVPTGIQSASDGVMSPQSGNAFQNNGYTSGLYGWSINDVGNAEFNNVNVRGELRASVFKINEITATAGTQGVFYSAATLQSNATTPATTGTSFFFNGKNDDFGAMMLGVGDIVRLKTYVNIGGVIIGDSWATVTARTNHSTYTTYTATLNNGSVNVTYPAGTAIVDYGPSGTGFITLSADGTIGSSPNLTMATHSGTPWNGFTTLMREGNLNGSYGYATNVYGVGLGQYGVSGANWQTSDTTNGIRIGNNSSTLSQWFPNGSLEIGQTGPNLSNVFISGGALDIRNNTTPRIHLASDGSGYLANSNISWNSSGDLTVIGNALIAGWSVNNGYFAKDTGSNSTSAGMAPTDFPFFAGSTYAGRATAPFRVTPAGALTASNATITGTVTATNGFIGGWNINATNLTSGSGSTTVGLDSGGTNPAIYAGNATPASAPFRVTNAGALTSSSGSIGGWNIGGTNLTIGSGGNTVGLDSGGTNPAIYAGSATPGAAPFRVTKTGALTSSSGSIGGWSIGPTSLSGGSTTLDSTSGLQISTPTSVLDSAGVTWNNGSITTAGLYNFSISGQTNTTLRAFSSSGKAAGLSVFTDGTNAYGQFYSLGGATWGGVKVGSASVPNASLDVDGAGWFSSEVRSDFGYRTRSGTGGTTGSDWFNIQWTGSVANLWIDGTNLGAITTSSDGRFKYNIANQSGDALARIEQLRPVTYRWQNKHPFVDDGQNHEGFIAQELRTVIPDAVKGDESKETLQVSILPIVSVLTKGEQELSAKVDQLQKQIDELKSQCHN